MGIRMIRLDDRAEGTLAELRNRTGLSTSEVFRRGLQAYAESVHCEMAETPYDVFRRFDLGPGGYAATLASQAKTAVAALIGKKHGRDLDLYRRT